MPWCRLYPIQTLVQASGTPSGVRRYDAAASDFSLLFRRAAPTPGAEREKGQVHGVRLSSSTCAAEGSSAVRPAPLPLHMWAYEKKRAQAQRTSPAGAGRWTEAIRCSPFHRVSPSSHCVIAGAAFPRPVENELTPITP